MTDDVLAVRYSPNGKLLAVSLLDSTVKVFYQDSLKFFLSLYGHKAGLVAAVLQAGIDGAVCSFPFSRWTFRWTLN